jgi:hypothetical protein
MKSPFTELEIKKAASGFYEGNSLPIAVISKSIMVALVLWALIWPGNANNTLGSWNWALLEGFNTFYIIAVGLFFFFLAFIALMPSTGRRVMGPAGQKPDFSNFSWFSMMFGAGLGVGLMVFATAEPLVWASGARIRSSCPVLSEAIPRNRFSLRTATRFCTMVFTPGPSMLLPASRWPTTPIHAKCL